jgi:cytochrome o ubiquinol oxidase operon protein cyoD
MSAQPQAATHAPAHPHGHSVGHSGAHAGSLRDYMTGFVLAVTLTAIPFWLVMAHTLARSSTTAAVILALAAVQIVIHMVYFLHMNTRSEGGWTLLALLFTLMLVVIALSGSLWVMYHLNHNMMPDMSDEGVVHDTPAVPHMHDMHDMHHMP